LDTADFLSTLWHCWLHSGKGICPVKTRSSNKLTRDEVLLTLYGTKQVAVLMNLTPKSAHAGLS